MKYRIKIKNPIYGIPRTSISKLNKGQFKVVDLLNRYTILNEEVNEKVKQNHSHCCNISGKPVYSRILIQKRK